MFLATRLKVTAALDAQERILGFSTGFWCEG